MLGRGINFGNALDALTEHGFRPTEAHFDEVRRAGFDTVRLPVRWSGHAATHPPYPIDSAFFDRVDRTVDRALACGLNVVLNMHHYRELQSAPEAHAARFLGLWRQIAPRYASHPDRLHLELLNEPCEALTPQRWNDLLAEALAVVRHADPDRAVIVGPASMNDVDALAELRLPDDERLIVTVHYYRPLEFTTQGADWVPGAERWWGTSWGTAGDHAAVRADLTAAAAWAAARGRPLFVGEFGVYDKVDMASRARWTAVVRTEVERLGASWAYWDFATDFGVFDVERHAWRTPLRQALLP
ncbi:glycoside hydrolase family 5 protein [Micromonosporaceae bacterium B7E4]